MYDYKDGVMWIALHDAPQEKRVKAVAEQITVALVADLFRRPVRTVARDVVALRKTGQTQRGPRRCQRRYGSCALNEGHSGDHNAYIGPWAGTSEGIDRDSDC
jgi:hypothetical protein